MPRKTRTTAWETKIRPRLKELEKWAEEDTDSLIAEKLGIDRKTLYLHRKRHPELEEAIQRGREKMSRKLRKSLYLLATGYTETETTKKTVVDDGSGTVQIDIVRTKDVAPSIKAIEALLGYYDPNYHADRDGYRLKMEALEIQREKGTSEEWEV